MTPAFITNVQVALCVPEADANGVVGPSTITAVRGYLQGGRRQVPPDPIDPTSADLRPLLQAAIDDVGSCTAGRFKTAFEVGRYGVPARTAKPGSRRCSRKLTRSSKASGSNVTMASTGSLMSRHERVLRRSGKLNGSSGDTIDAALAKQILALP